MTAKKKLLRVTTVSDSLDVLLKGQLKFLNNFFEIIGVASDTGSLSRVSEREGIRVINVRMDRKISLIRDVKSLVRMIEVIKREKPLIIHANTPKGSLLAMVAGKFCGVKHRVYTVTGLRFETAKGSFRKLLIFMEKLTCACATKVIPEGDGVKRLLVKEHITKKTLAKILNGNINGIDVAFFDRANVDLKEQDRLRQVLNIQKSDFVFCFVGRLVKDKGINELIAAFRRINNEKPNTKLLLVGPFEKELDPLTPETEKEIEINPSIITTGFQNDIRPYLSISDLFVFPSYREGFPNVVMQAGAMELPSIVTDINGCNEIIIEGENGVIIPPKDEKALEEAMLKLFHDDELRKSLAKQARPLIVSRYEQTIVWEALLAEYNRLLEAKYLANK